MKKPVKIYPSSSGFKVGRTYEVEYNSACLRYLVVSQGIPKDIDPIYQKLGLQHEDWYADQMKEQILHREKPIQTKYRDIEYSGRIDFIMKNGEIHETKASLSKNFLYSTIRKKQVKLSHLAQLLSYLIHSESQNGQIIAGFYKENKDGELELKETAKFLIRITDTGNILVDGVEYKYRVADSISYLLTLVDALENDKILGRPMRFDKWKDPCTYCPLNALCDKLDAKEITEDKFKEQSKTKLREEANVSDKV